MPWGRKDMADMMIDSYDTDSMLMEIEQVVNNGANGANGAEGE